MTGYVLIPRVGADVPPGYVEAAQAAFDSLPEDIFDGDPLERSFRSFSWRRTKQGRMYWSKANQLLTIRVSPTHRCECKVCGRRGELR